MQDVFENVLIRTTWPGHRQWSLIISKRGGSKVISCSKTHWILVFTLLHFHCCLLKKHMLVPHFFLRQDLVSCLSSCKNRDYPNIFCLSLIATSVEGAAGPRHVGVENDRLRIGWIEPIEPSAKLVRVVVYLGSVTVRSLIDALLSLPT